MHFLNLNWGEPRRIYPRWSETKRSSGNQTKQLIQIEGTEAEPNRFKARRASNDWNSTLFELRIAPTSRFL
jgi:hypothetical protein